MKMFAALARSRKSVTALVVGVIGWVTQVPDFHHVTRSGWTSLAIIVASAFGVYTVSNDPAPAEGAPTAEAFAEALPAATPRPGLADDSVPAPPVVPPLVNEPTEGNPA